MAAKYTMFIHNAELISCVVHLLLLR